MNAPANERPDLAPLREILHHATQRYLTVRPHGFVLNPEQPPRARVTARILNIGAARTLYRAKRPSCRSLDGVKSITHTERICLQCRLRTQCTAQVRLDLFIDTKPFRLLLAYTSAQQFLAYHAQLQQRQIKAEHHLHSIAVINRGTWGELRFTLID